MLLLSDASWPLGENEGTDAMESGVVPLLSVLLRALGVEPGLDVSSRGAGGLWYLCPRWMARRWSRSFRR